jgi:predicted nucleotidyltransferase
MAIQNADILRVPTAGDPVLSEVVRRLVEAYRPEYIYLFGPVARGDAGPDSDYDIMVVVPDEAPREMQE